MKPRTRSARHSAVLKPSFKVVLPKSLREKLRRIGNPRATEDEERTREAERYARDWLGRMEKDQQAVNPEPRRDTPS